MSHYNSSMEEIHQNLQLLSCATTTPPPPPPPSSSSARFDGPSLDLQLSISVDAPNSDNDCTVLIDPSYVEALKWQAAEQIRLAAMERAYAERVMEMTRREMEIARSEFVRARSLWDRAREEVERAERMRERAGRASTGSTCMEITCLSCRQKFRP